MRTGIQSHCEINATLGLCNGIDGSWTGNSDAVLMDSVVANYMINEAGKIT